MKNFLPWVGGKSQLRKTIISHFPQVTPARYVEVFGGGGWVLLGKDKHAPTEVFNDVDGQLINLYRCVQNHCAELQRELRSNQVPLNSRQLFFDYLAQIDMPGLTDIQRAARYYYIIRISYGAGRREFGCTPKTLDPIEDLPEIQQRLKKVVIENRDFAAVVKTYDTPKTLFYLDPPYYKAEDFYQGFTRDDHVRLFDVLQRIKGQWLLSYNDTPEIRKLYGAYNIISLERNNPLSNRYGSGRTNYKELLIKNY